MVYCAFHHRRKRFKRSKLIASRLPFLFLVIGWFAVIAILPFLVTLLIMFLSHIEEIPKKKAQTVGIPMTQTPRTANGYDAAPQLEASAPQEPLAATVFDAAEYGVPPEANDEESASDEAEGFTPSSSESQSVEEAVQIQATENRTRKDGIPLAMDDDTSVWAGVSEQSRRSSESNESGPGVSMEDYNGPSPLDAPGTSGYSDDHTALLTERTKSTTEIAQKVPRETANPGRMGRTRPARAGTR